MEDRSLDELVHSGLHLFAGEQSLELSDGADEIVQDIAEKNNEKFYFQQAYDLKQVSNLLERSKDIKVRLAFGLASA